MGNETCVCGATESDPCKRPVGLACARDQARAAARWRGAKGPNVIADDLRLIESMVGTTIRDLDSASEDYVWTVDAARHFVERLGAIEELVGKAKLAVDDQKRAAMSRRAGT